MKKKMLDYFGISSTPKINANFELLRAAACLLVCSEHLFQFRNTFLNIGVLGLNIFFILSGFLITKSLKKYSIKEFIKHRMLRIYPTFIFISIIIAVLFHHKLSTIISQIFMVNDLFEKPKMLAVQWSLMIEMRFYLIAIVCFYFLNKKKFLQNYLICSTALLLVFILAGRSYAAQETFGGLIVILIGVMIYNRESVYKMIPLLILAALAWCELNIYYFFCSLLSMSLATFIFLLFERKIKIKRNIIISFFASISYPLYLVHYAIDISNFELIEKLITFICMIIFSYLVRIFIEKKALNLFKN